MKRTIIEPRSNVTGGKEQPLTNLEMNLTNWI